MNITVIMGTSARGCTFAMKEQFLFSMGSGHSVTEFVMPDACPVFCTGCKVCFHKDITACPHAEYTVPIWESIVAADLLVFCVPTYVFHAPAQVKAQLDHFGKKWMAHSPDKEMFSKKAVIITNAIGQGMGKTAKDIKDSLDFWGVARTYTITQALFQADWKLVSDKRKAAIKRKCDRVAKRVKPIKKVKPRLKIRGLFFVMKMSQKMINKSELKAGRPSTADYIYWKEQGWL
jgi:Multimeric flavodoxin WrbA